MCCCVVFYNCHSLNFFNSAAFHCECNFFFKKKRKKRKIKGHRQVSVPNICCGLFELEKGYNSLGAGGKTLVG